MKLPNKLGFTLIELSIVLVILGLIIGTLAPLFVTLTKKSKMTDGRELVATARDEVKGEIIRTRILPTNLSNIGHTTDPWQNPLVYIPAPQLAGQDLCTWLAGGTPQPVLRCASMATAPLAKKAISPLLLPPTVITSIGRWKTRSTRTALGRIKRYASTPMERKLTIHARSRSKPAEGSI